MGEWWRGGKSEGKLGIFEKGSLEEFEEMFRVVGQILKW